MKIAMIAGPFISIPPDGTGPIEFVISNLTEELVKRGHEILLYATGDSRTSATVRYIYGRSFKSMALGAHAIPRYIQDLITLDHLFWSVQDAQKSGAQVIHSHNMKALMFQRALSIPQVFTMHFSFMDDIGQSFLENTFEFFGGFPNIQFVTLSESHRRLCPPGDNIHIIHHGIDANEYPLVEQKDDYLLCLSRLTREKGIHTAIEVAERSGLRLKIAGPSSAKLHGPTLSLDAEYEEELMERLRKYPHAEYLGEADHRAKMELLQGASALLFPITWDEPFGLTLLEGMACGTLIIAFNRGSVPEIVKDGVSGYVVSDQEEMTRKVGKLDRLSHAAIRDHVCCNFTVERMAESYERVYRKAIEEFQQPV